MYKTFTFLSLCFFTLFVKAQTPAPTVQDYGKIDIADLELKSCDFEKDANAMILFDEGNVFYDHNLDLAMERHKRIKIFNDNGKDKANIRIEYYSGGHYEYITGLQAQTINLVDGKPEITKLDKKLIYTEHIDKGRTALVFSMPNVKAGSVIEFKYVWNSNSISNFPDWYFQDKIPTRYSELTTQIPDIMYFKLKSNVVQPFIKYTKSSESRSIGSGTDAISYTLEKETRGLANIHSLPDEPYMTAVNDNLQSMVYKLTSIRPLGTFTKSYSDSWAKVGGILADDDDFGGQLKKKLDNEDEIIATAKERLTTEAKVAYIFNEVKNRMKWDGIDRWYTNDGTAKAWEKKTGNSAEINLILYHLLNKAGVTAYPMVVSTREHGKVVPYFTFLYQFNRAVVYVPINDDKTYVLDATNKYNIYNEIPSDILNSDALYIDKDKKQYDMLYITRQAPVRRVVILNGEIKPDGKMEGEASLNSFSYNRIKSIDRYKTDGEKKYIDYLTENNNNLKVSSLKFDGMDVDTVPLVQHIKFNMDLTGSDENYIIFNPNLFTSLHNNPFLSENRYTDIDFGYRNNYTINGTFKIPASYTVDALPKSTSMIMPDSSITFKRIMVSDGSQIAVRYNIDFKKTMYTKEEYPLFREFCKKMYEMLNEQIVLKKS
ncbi:DUF3857 domain-containing protein [Mucilaginibacter segetis]|uniref:DUF3857 domain-containing protein n=1 Tax=Mucilaginibacter segetis TaxID=2793071 RepID=A0A934PUE1_9SPHI|nr:DUF3857 domain-containing protein [Mucilaginibacter segetis]MBK0379756.1 DUF3857 domain-containing protein [Mucilaginibacter segetis]